MDAVKNFFRPPPDPREQARKWKRDLRREERQLDRLVKQQQAAEKKLAKEIKGLAKNGDMGSVRVLARQLVTSKRHTERLYMSKVHISSVMNEITARSAMMRMQGAMAKSAEVMEAMNALCKVSDMAQTMQTMAREMERAGLMDELMEDAMGDMDGDGVQEEADEEVDRVVAELTADVLGTTAATVAPTTALPEPPPAVAAAAAAPAAASASAEDPGTTEEIAAMRARLEAL